MSSIRVRPAALADARGIARVHVQAWQEAYANHVDEAALAALDVDARATRWSEIIEKGSTEVFVAEDDATIVGWASASSGRDSDAPAPRELEGIYVLARVYGTGAGQQLLDASIGDEAAYLWVLDGNSRAEAFYRRNGFRADGARRGHVLLGTPLTVVRYVRRAGALS